MDRRMLKVSAMAAGLALGTVATDALAQAAPVTLRQAPFVADEDYPGRALRSEVDGPVTVDIAVDATGMPTGCTVVSVETPDWGLEEATCSIWTERARYAPARNAAGRAVAGVYRGRVNWQIPEDLVVMAEAPGPASAAARGVQTIVCDSDEGDFVWRIDLANNRITNEGGPPLAIVNIVRNEDGSGRIEAETTYPYHEGVYVGDQGVTLGFRETRTTGGASTMTFTNHFYNFRHIAFSYGDCRPQTGG